MEELVAVETATDCLAGKKREGQRWGNEERT